jgi:hypothetical protein
MMSASSGQHHREDRPPVSVRDLVDRHLCRATDSDVFLRRYRRLLRDVCIAVAALLTILFCVAALLGVLVMVTDRSLGLWMVSALGGTGVLGVSARMAITRRRRTTPRESPSGRAPGSTSAEDPLPS